MRRYYDTPLIIEFPEKGLVSFQYKTYLDIEKMDSFLAYINVRYIKLQHYEIINFLCLFFNIFFLSYYSIIILSF